VCNESEQVVASHEAHRPGGDLLDDVVGHRGSTLTMDFVEFDDAERDERKRRLHALRAICFAKQPRDQVGAIAGFGIHGCRVYRQTLENH